MNRETLTNDFSIVFAVGNSIIMTKMRNSMKIECVMTLMPLSLLLLLINVSEVHLSTTGGKMAKVLDGKTFGLHRNYDIWDDDHTREKRGFFEEKAAVTEDEDVVREDDVFGVESRNQTERRSKGQFTCKFFIQGAPRVKESKLVPKKGPNLTFCYDFQF